MGNDENKILEELTKVEFQLKIFTERKEKLIQKLNPFNKKLFFDRIELAAEKEVSQTFPIILPNTIHNCKKFLM